jgi:hypothetical protein
MAHFAFKIHWDMLYVLCPGQRVLKQVLGGSDLVVRCSKRSVYVTSQSQFRERDYLVVSAKKLGPSSSCVSRCRYFISLVISYHAAHSHCGPARGDLIVWFVVEIRFIHEQGALSGPRFYCVPVSRVITSSLISHSLIVRQSNCRGT